MISFSILCPDLQFLADVIPFRLSPYLETCSNNRRTEVANEVKKIKSEMDSLRSSLKDKADENAELLRRIKSMTEEIVSRGYWICTLTCKS